MTKQAEAFKREWKCVVLKRSDMRKFISDATQKTVEYLSDVLNTRRRETGKEPLDCVVVEKDWPEHDFVWKLIENRVTGGTPLSVYEAAPLLLEALRWYEERARLCRSFGNAGESARSDLDRDGGQRARAAIAKARGCGGMICF